MELHKITKGLPEELLTEKPLLEQYLFRDSEVDFSGSLIFKNGAIFNVKKDDSGQFKWVYFTRLRSEGIFQLRNILEKEFEKTESNIGISEKQNCMIWISNLGEKPHKIKVEAGLYSGLPAIFKKIEDIINNNLVTLK